MQAVRLLTFAIPLALMGQEFEAASIKLEPRTPGSAFYPPKGGPGTADPTTWRYQKATLSSLVELAYNKKFYEVSAPDWSEQELFSITAKVPAGATVEDFHLMLRHLLEERFGLKVHHETRQLPGYVLTTVKNGPRFKETVPDPNPPAHSNAPLQHDENGYPLFAKGSGFSMAMMNGKGRFHLPDESMGKLAEQLSFQLRGPVKDETTLTGKYDLDFYWDARTVPPPDGDLGPDLIHAVKEQLGLNLEARKVPVDIIVIDKAERTPTEN